MGPVQKPFSSYYFTHQNQIEKIYYIKNNKLILTHMRVYRHLDKNNIQSNLNLLDKTWGEIFIMRSRNYIL